MRLKVKGTSVDNKTMPILKQIYHLLELDPKSLKIGQKLPEQCLTLTACLNHIVNCLQVVFILRVNELTTGLSRSEVNKALLKIEMMKTLIGRINGTFE
jgi:hypothetical protein